MIEIATFTEVVRRIRAAREQKGLSGEYVAAAIGTTDASISRWENNEREGKVTVVARAGAVLDMTPNELLLKSPNEVRDDLPEEHKSELARLFLELTTTVRLMGPEGPAAIRSLTEFFNKQNRKFSGSDPAATLPPGTAIKKEGDWKTMEPLPASPQKTPKRYRVGEAKASYGRKKRKGG